MTMTISDLIGGLQRVLEQSGDMPVVWDLWDDTGGKGHADVESISVVPCVAHRSRIVSTNLVDGAPVLLE